MRMEELQTGFFGYRKESVYQLIASMEENFSSKLMEKDAQHTKAMQDAQIKIAELETELRTVRAEHLSSRKDQDMISDTLLDAQAHPDQYQDLVVRVAGYSANFTKLAKDVQDALIARTEQSF